jgi:ankyrin repeat protein
MALLAAVDRHGNTALHAAAGRGWDTTVALLLQLDGTREQRQALLAAVNHVGRTALHLAVNRVGERTSDIVTALLHGCGTDESRRALVAAVDNQGLTALHLSAISGQVAAVTALLAHAAGDCSKVLTYLLIRPWHDDLAACCGTLVSMGAMPTLTSLQRVFNSEHVLSNLRRVIQAQAACALVPDLAAESMQVCCHCFFTKRSRFTHVPLPHVLHLQVDEPSGCRAGTLKRRRRQREANGVGSEEQQD